MAKSTANKLKKVHFLDAMRPALAIALDAIGSTKDQREQVKSGIYDVEATLRIRTVLKVGEDAPVKQVNKIEPWTIIALLLDKLPGTKIDEVIAEADALLQIKEKEEGLRERATAAEERAQHVLDTVKPAAVDGIDAIKEGTKQMRKGAVKVEDVEIKVIDEQVKLHVAAVAKK
jgi:hypothetical protein